MENKTNRVTKISANPLLQKQDKKDSFLRVAAYCRVSTDSDDQIESYKAQVKYYTDVINRNPNWKLVDIYADEGISGTRTKKRVNFLRMIKDCNNGKIDMILTKSVARFARNTVDSLNYVRKLKAAGIGVYFEEQGLDSLKADSEMFIGLHSVLAQAESENISANVRWGLQQRMKAGTFKFRYNILGYKKGENGEPEIVESEAEVIRKIYSLYLEGYSLIQIKHKLEDDCCLTKCGLTNWTTARIKSILTNERYCGDMLMQKTFVENCLTKKIKRNKGEFPQYYIKDNHPAIVNREIFNNVQIEMTQRSIVRKKNIESINKKGKYSGKYILTNLVFCGECGSPYRRRVWSKPSGKKAMWCCVNRVDNGIDHCKNVNIKESLLYDAIRRAIKKLFNKKDECMEAIRDNCNFLMTREKGFLLISSLEGQIKEYEKTIDVAVSAMINTTGNVERYEKEIGILNEKIVDLKEKLEVEKEKIDKKIDNLDNSNLVKELMKSAPDLVECDDVLLKRIVSQIRIMKDKKIVVILKGGYQVEEEIRDA